MKTFEAFVNKSKYNMLVVRIETMKEGYLFQNLCFEHEIYWAGAEGTKKTPRMLGDGGDNYLYIALEKPYPRMHRSDEYQEFFVDRYKRPDKIFTIADFNEVKSILETGSAAPSYAPRRIDRTLEKLNESQYFTSNNDLPLDDMPKYKIGDVVKFRENAEGIQLTASSNYWGFINNQKRFVEENKGKPLTIVQKYTTSSNMINPAIRNKWFSAFSSNIPGVSIMWFLDETIEPAMTIPNYRPRRIDRTLESYDNSTDITSSKYFTEYNTLVFSITSEDKATDVVLFLSKMSKIFDGGLDNSTIRYIMEEVRKESQYIRMSRERYGSFDWGYSRLTSFSSFAAKENYTYKRIYSFNEITNNLNYILKYGNIVPSYAPRKIDRTLESKMSGYDAELLKDRLSKGKYTCINFGLYDNLQAKKIKNYLSELGFIEHTSRIYYDNLADRMCKTIFTINTSSFDPFYVYGSGEGEHMEDGSFAVSYPNYTVSPILSVDELIKYIESYRVPNYRPRKIDRTLESKKFWPYRFKTKEEFVKNYGYDWQHRIQTANPDGSVGVSWAGQMDDLLGQSCKIEGIDMSVNQRYHLPTTIIDRGFWIITNEMLTKNKPLEPSYAPRRIDRTLESVGDTLWREIVFELKNNADAQFVQEELYRRGYHWWTDIKEVKYFSRYPVYLFVEFDRNEISAANLRELESSTIDEYIKGFNRNSGLKAINPKVFLPRDVLNIESIRVRGEAAPSYSPRKIIKESIGNKYYYRFKTEREFREEFGSNWRDRAGLWWAPENHMDYLFGTKLEVDFPDNRSEVSIPNKNPDCECIHWDINKKMLVKEIIGPSYAPRKIDRTL